MKKNVFILLAVTLGLYSCSDENKALEDSNDLVKSSTIIIKERDPDVPWIPNEKKTKNEKRSRSIISLSTRNFLGYSMNNKYYPIIDSRNLGINVIDINKLSKDNAQSVMAFKTKSSDVSFFSYTNSDRFTSNTTMSKRVSSGGTFKLGPVSFGNSKVRTETFTQSVTNNKDAVFGELNIVIRDSTYRIRSTTNVKQQIIKNYLSSDFKNELYNNSSNEFFNTYGAYVLFDFTTGGKASAMYAGISKTNSSITKKETDMDKEINSSFSFGGKTDKDNEYNGDIKLGRKNSSSSEVSVTNAFSKLLMSIKTIGGSTSLSSFSAPKEINSISLDLSGWASSLNDKSTHDMIETGDNGLIPISEFIIEDNIKEQIEYYMREGYAPNDYIQETEPYLLIDGIPRWNGFFSVTISIIPRFDMSNLSGGLLDTSLNSVLLRAYDGIFIHDINYAIYDMQQTFGQMFGLKIKTNLGTPVKPVGTPPIADRDGFRKGLLTKFVFNGTTYLLSKQERALVKKNIALSFYGEDVIDKYAIRKLLNSTPVDPNMTFEKLIKEYSIIAL